MTDTVTDKITVICRADDLDDLLMFDVVLPPGCSVRETDGRAVVGSLLGPEEDLEYRIKQDVIRQLSADREHEYDEDEVTLFFAFTGTPTVPFDWRF